ncbi:hypothetical protein N474_00185 [Pseudoalteromonas luteoviolacea CPMOR-2]|uniref:Uncharacterized protein n=1 Tax=Pseudoalteromonas luteoviolacea DSM 6061 TaxID=1365250 RepID=A0A166WR44_9GAMM|nr:hypothetical protein N475_02880 [Pseudoalteromonas luteoviolacea DSM 6061]KZN60631.1 hypothetical protein N474_00185 [Pseudoalteromonas luteoviolacea CPMOR-2]
MLKWFTAKLNNFCFTATDKFRKNLHYVTWQTFQTQE